MRKILYAICEAIAFFVMMFLMFLLGFCELLDEGIRARKERKQL